MLAVPRPCGCGSAAPGDFWLELGLAGVGSLCSRFRAPVAGVPRPWAWVLLALAVGAAVAGFCGPGRARRFRARSRLGALVFGVLIRRRLLLAAWVRLDGGWRGLALGRAGGLRPSARPRAVAGGRAAGWCLAVGGLRASVRCPSCVRGVGASIACGLFVRGGSVRWGWGCGTALVRARRCRACAGEAYVSWVEDAVTWWWARLSL